VKRQKDKLFFIVMYVFFYSISPQKISFCSIPTYLL